MKSKNPIKNVSNYVDRFIKKIDIELIEEALEMRINNGDINENNSEFPLVIDLNYKASNSYRHYSKNLRLAKKLSLVFRYLDHHTHPFLGELNCLIFIFLVIGE